MSNKFNLGLFLLIFDSNKIFVITEYDMNVAKISCEHVRFSNDVSCYVQPQQISIVAVKRVRKCTLRLVISYQIMEEQSFLRKYKNCKIELDFNISTISLNSVKWIEILFHIFQDFIESCFQVWTLSVFEEIVQTSLGIRYKNNEPR